MFFCSTVYAQGESNLPSTLSSIVSSLVALAFVILLIFATLRIMKALNRKDFMHKSDNIELVETLVISRNASIHLIILCGREFAIVEHNNSITILDEFESGTFKVKDNRVGDFSSLFVEKIKKFKNDKDNKRDE